MTNHSAVKPAGRGPIIVIASALVVAAFALWMVDRSGKNGSGLPDDFKYQIDEYKQIDPSLIAYQDVRVFPSNMKAAKAIAVGPGDEIHVVGDQSLRVFDSTGAEVRTVELEASPSCVAVAPSEHAMAAYVFMGVGDHVEVYDSEGNRTATWPSLGDRALLTSIAIDEEDIFVADAGQSRIHRLNLDGKVVGTIGDHDAEGNQAAFAVPSPFFDVAIHPDGWLRVVNPGALRVEAFSFDGNLELFWGKASADIEGFYGCCNPANMAILPDGRFITAEKGLVRVKVYSADGQFESVVAGPDTFGAAAAAANESLSDHEHTAADVAVDSAGRVIVLDLTTAQVHVFDPKQATDHE